MKKRNILSLMLLMSMTFTTYASPSFYVSPGTNPNGDLGWQNIAGEFVEEDFDGYATGTVLESFEMGGVSVTPSVNAKEIFHGSFSSAGGQYGTVFGGALLSNSTNSLTLTFSSPVTGFGLWLFDDTRSSVDSFTMIVNSGSSAHIVEGFLGVIDPNGFSSVTISSLSDVAFEIDHLQLSVFSIPVPSAVWLFGSGLIGVVGMRKKSKLSALLA